MVNYHVILKLYQEHDDDPSGLSFLEDEGPVVKRVPRCTGFNRQLAVVGHIKVQKTFSQHRLFGSSGCIDYFPTRNSIYRGLSPSMFD